MLIRSLAVLVSLSALAAAEPKFEDKGKKEDVKDVKDVTWTAKGEAGLVATTGNSRTTNITVGADATRKDKDNKVEATVAFTYAKATTRTATDANANGVIDPGELSTASATSAENLLGKLRYDRYLTGADALYVAALAGFDKPAGMDFIGGGQAGYSRSLYKEGAHEILGEVGYDLSYLKLTAGSSSTIHSGRAFAGYKGKVEKDTALEASVEALFNLNSVTFGMRTANALSATRVNGLVGVTSALSSKLSLNASFTVKYTNFPAPLAKIGLPFAPGFEPEADKTDTILKVSLIVSFL